MKSFEINAKPTIVFYLHGLRGHGLAQKAALQHMVKNLGVSLISLEMDGHGEDSVRRHCLVPHYRKTVNDICDEIKRSAKDAEQIIVMGYSFGASLMSLAAQQLETDRTFKAHIGGVVGICTALDVGHNVSAWKLWLSKIIGPTSRFLFERASPLSSFLTIHEMNVDLISADPVVVQSIKDDPLVYKGRIPLATSSQVYQAGLAADQVLKKTSLEVLLLHSKDDQIALPPKEHDFPANVSLKLFNALRHNCIDGTQKEVVHARRFITQFIVDKL